MCGAELKVLPEVVQRVSALLQCKHHPHLPVMRDDAVRTARQAADALGVALGQIAKSIVFRRQSDDVAVLVITSGDRRVDESKLELLVCLDGERLARANAEFVKAKTGFSVGGVAPVAHTTATVVLIDRSLFRFVEIWAAAGHPHAVFRLSPQDLERLTAAPVVDVALDTGEEQLALERAVTLVRMRAAMIGNNKDVPSPCISVCRMSDLSGLCQGCFRTSEEIAGWSSAGDTSKLQIWKLVGQRMDALQT